MGVSTLLFTDGTSAILTDGFFSRPGKLSVALGKIGPDRDTITRCLRKAGISQLLAVTAAHSHYDHAMDSPVVAELTGAVLLGSESTLNIGRGCGLAEEKMIAVTPHHRYEFGPFTLTFVESEHSPGGKWPGAITAPVHAPAKVDAYRMAQCYSLVLEHGGRAILIHASAGYRTGMLAGFSCDVAFLGTTLVTKQDQHFQDGYWNETVTAVGAQRVFPIHWDDFMRPLWKPLVPLPRFIDDFDETIDYLKSRKRSDGVDFQIPQTWKPFDPFANL